jgi:glutamate carboxypeptidase
MSRSPLVEEIRSAAAGLLEELCAISSESGDLAGLHAMGERLALELKPFGFRSELLPAVGIDGREHPVLVAAGPTAVTAPRRRVLLVGHLDTVLPAVPPHREPGRLHGTGALDMKGGFAALVGALHLLSESGGAVPEDLLLVGVPDEEVGGPISARMVREWGREARAMLVLEPGQGRMGGETLVAGRRGLAAWRLDVRGRAAHSGLDYWQGRSAIAAAAAFCASAQGLSERGAGPVVNVGRIVGGDSDFVRDLAEEHRFIGTSQRINVVPDSCVAEGEVRFLCGEDGDRILALLQELAAQEGQRWEVAMSLRELERVAPMTPSGPAGELAAKLVEAAERDGWTLELERDRGGVSFPNCLPDPSALPILDGLGPVGGGMHTRGEYLDLGSLGRRIPLIAEAISLAAALPCPPQSS